MFALAAAGLVPNESGAAGGGTDLEAAALKRHDKAADRLLKLQITDPASPHRGGFPDAYGLFHPGSAGGMVSVCNAAFLHPKSRFSGDPLMIERLKLAIDYMQRSQSADGNLDNPITNFNSPPDTAFAVQGVAAAANIARQRNHLEILGLLEPFLKNGARGLIKGGMHTPNHRWVMCAAMAQIHELFPDPALVRRIDQWLAEGIDIDEDGQFDERSILTYNPITDRALLLTSIKLNRPALLDPVRKNLDCAFYLMHPGGEMVTGISRRQDRNQRGNIGVYWMPMHYLALRDGNPLYAAVAHKYASEQASLPVLMEYPEMLKPLPAPAPLPDNYEKVFPALNIARIRRGLTSATLLLGGDSRFFMLRRGDCVVNAVRFASAFFGKAQFIPQSWRKEGASYLLHQSLSGPYFQPLDPPRRIKALEWEETRPERARSEIGFLNQAAAITETEKGFLVRIQSSGTNGVPVAIEVSVRGQEGLEMDGLLRAPDIVDGFLLPAGEATIRTGGHQIRFGPGKQANSYTQVRGAEPKLPGGSVYITGFTPFDHTLEFVCG
jgi:hypothetical protein